jgi:60 kDa SS-A/Ro ribonucleoprotein
MNLLLNLSTFTRHGVFKSEENVEYAVAKFTNPRAVEHSKVLPFRFFDAYRQYVSAEHDVRLADALRQALELSFVNMPSLGDRKVALGIDTSGSMSNPVSERGMARYIDIAGIFTGALLKRIEGRAIPLPFDTRVHHDHTLSSRDDVMVTVGKVASYGGGCTAVGSPIEHLLRSRTKVDAFVGITDNVDWAHGQGHSCSGSFLELWRSYRTQVAPDAKAFLVTIAPYRELVAPSGERGVHFIYGWNDKALRYISLQLESGESQVAQVERMTL